MTSIRAKIGAATMGGALVLGAAAGAYALTGTAGAQDTTTSTPAAGDIAPAPAPDLPGRDQGHRQGSFDPSRGGHVFNGITEALLTGDAEAKARAAAAAAVPGGTIERVENDAEGDAYEAHVTKSDGSRVTVKMDADFNVTGTEDGPGRR